MKSKVLLQDLDVWYGYMEESPLFQGLLNVIDIMSKKPEGKNPCVIPVAVVFQGPSKKNSSNNCGKEGW